ncbi:Poly(A) RNA polymerase gld-2 homolog A [Sergentomyia squamirostris]
MYSPRNEVAIESHGENLKKINGEKQNRPNSGQTKRRNISGVQNSNHNTGGNKRRIHYNNQNNSKIMLFPSAPERRPFSTHHQSNLSPVIEITVSGHQSNKNNQSPVKSSSLHHETINGDSGIKVNGDSTNETHHQMHQTKYHHHPQYNRGHYNHHHNQQKQNYYHQQALQVQDQLQYPYQGGDGKRFDHKWQCSGWGACKCGFQKQWNGNNGDYPQTPTQKNHGNLLYTDSAGSRSPTPSLKSESPPAIPHNSPHDTNKLFADSQLPNRNGYESDSSHPSHQQQQQQQQQPYVTSCDYFFDLSSSSYQLVDMISAQQQLQCIASSQSSLSSGGTDDTTTTGYSYEFLPYLPHRTSYGLLYADPTGFLGQDVDGSLRKRFVSMTSPKIRRPNSATQYQGRRRVETPPDHYIAKAHLVMTKKMPKELLTGGHWDDLSQMVWNKFMGAQQTEDTYVKKMNLWKSLFVYIRNTYPRFGLYLVGSTMTGFGADNSDVDMCLVSKYRTELEPRIEAIFNLTELQNFLSQNKKYEMFHLIEAKVPILRFQDVENHIEVDLNYNNCVGIRNTHLLYWYSNMDWRVRPLALVVKLWAQYHCINNAKNSTISSYSLVLMVIHFLQVGVTPAVLPCLQEMYPEKFGINNDIRTININEQFKSFNSHNQQTLGELFLQFLEYYSNFDYSQYAISVRTASCLPIDFCRNQRSPKNDIHQWKHLCIEEPFDLTNTARSVYDSEVFEKIKYIFVGSWRTLEATLDLKAVFKPFFAYPSLSTPSR